MYLLVHTSTVYSIYKYTVSGEFDAAEFVTLSVVAFSDAEREQHRRAHVQRELRLSIALNYSLQNMSCLFTSVYTKTSSVKNIFVSSRVLSTF